MKGKPRAPEVRKRPECSSLGELVARYDLRDGHAPDRPYPVEGNYDLPAGWIPVVERLVQRLILLGWDRRLAQVKEKFGGLRFYIDKRAGQTTEAMIAEIHRAYEEVDLIGGGR